MEARKLKRRHLVYYLRVFDRDTGQPVGQLVDVTTEGLMLISEDPIEVGAALHLEMDLPQGTAGDRRTALNAKVIWCRPDVNPRFHVMGLHLDNVAPEQVGRIEQMIREIGFQD